MAGIRLSLYFHGGITTLGMKTKDSLILSFASCFFTSSGTAEGSDGGEGGVGGGIHSRVWLLSGPLFISFSGKVDYGSRTFLECTEIGSFSLRLFLPTPG